MGGSAAEILCREIIAEQTRHFGTGKRMCGTYAGAFSAVLPVN